MEGYCFAASAKSKSPLLGQEVLVGGDHRFALAQNSA
jgi:hypothetical protein